MRMGQREDSLYAIASGQQGFFTYKQAIAAGYAQRTHSYHVGTGAWVREHRGIYRLARFPVSPEAQYVIWSLWSRGHSDVPQGVYCRQTALSLYELSDLNPAQLHMSVPPPFRRSIPPPAILMLYHEAIPATVIEVRQGYRLTSPLRTLLDLVREAHESRDHLQQALQQALARGLITLSEIQRSPDRQSLETVLEGVRT
jgi:predicted transcriptional regulator of viral defense system